MLKQKRVYRFGAFQLDPEEFTLTRGGKPVELAGKAFQILVLLVENHGQLVRKDKIITAVWPDSHVSTGNLDVNLNTIKKALQEDYIKNVPRQGYRFVEPVTEILKDETAQIPAGSRIDYRKWAWAILLIPLAVVFYLIFNFKNHIAPSPARAGSALYQKALEYEQVGDDEQALTTLDQALSADPSFGEACVRAAYLAYELEDMPKATEYLNRCTGMAPEGSPVELKAQALREFLADNSARSIELYQLLIDRYPHDVDALYRFAEVATEIDRIQEADKAVDACLKIEPANPYCRFQLMYVRLKQNRFDDVIADYNALPIKLRDYPWFDEPLGVAFMGKDQISQAREAFERLTRAQPKLHGTSHFTTGKEWLADIMLYEGHVKDATRRIQQVMETGDNTSSGGGYLVYLGRIHAFAGDTRQAVSFASQVASVPGDAGDLTAAAVVLASVGDVKGSERLLKLRASKTSAPLSPAHDHLIRGMTAVAKGNFSNGIEEMRLARDLHPWDEETAYWLGMVYLRSRDYKSALDMFQRVRGLKGAVLLDDAPMLVALTLRRIAECYEGLGDSNAAKPYFAEAERIWISADKELMSAGHAVQRNSR